MGKKKKSGFLCVWLWWEQKDGSAAPFSGSPGGCRKEQPSPSARENHKNHPATTCSAPPPLGVPAVSLVRLSVQKAVTLAASPKLTLHCRQTVFVPWGVHSPGGPQAKFTVLFFQALLLAQVGSRRHGGCWRCSLCRNTRCSPNETTPRGGSEAFWLSCQHA